MITFGLGVVALGQHDAHEAADEREHARARERRVLHEVQRGRDAQRRARVDARALLRAERALHLHRLVQPRLRPVPSVEEILYTITI